MKHKNPKYNFHDILLHIYSCINCPMKSIKFVYLCVCGTAITSGDAPWTYIARNSVDKSSARSHYKCALQENQARDSPTGLLTCSISWPRINGFAKAELIIYRTLTQAHWKVIKSNDFGNA